MLSDTFLNQFKKSSCLVTGGTGMIGRQIVQILCDAGAHVRVASLDRIVVDSRADHKYADLTDFSTCKELTSGMDYVIHVAGIKGSIEVTKSKPASFFVPLLMMNTNVLEAARISKVKRLIYTSSIGAYPSAEVFHEKDGQEGAPMDTFPGWAKRMGELQVQAYRIQYGLSTFSVVRPCNVYGPGDNFDPDNAMVIPSLMCRIRRGDNPVTVWGDGSAIRDFAFSRDVAHGVLLALMKGTGDLPFLNIASGCGYTVRELVNTLHGFLEFKSSFDITKPSGFPRRVMDITAATEKIGYTPETSLADGLKETWDWFIANESEFTKRKNYFTEPDDRSK